MIRALEFLFKIQNASALDSYQNAQAVLGQATARDYGEEGPWKIQVFALFLVLGSYF